MYYHFIRPDGPPTVQINTLQTFMRPFILQITTISRAYFTKSGEQYLIADVNVIIQIHIASKFNQGIKVCINLINLKYCSGLTQTLEKQLMFFVSAD